MNKRILRIVTQKAVLFGFVGYALFGDVHLEDTAPVSDRVKNFMFVAGYVAVIDAVLHLKQKNDVSRRIGETGII